MTEAAASARVLYSTSRVEPTDDGIRIRIKPPKPVVLIGFLGVWFVGWTIGGLSAIGGLLRGGPIVVVLFALVWLAGWLAGETIVGAVLAYLIAGEQVLTFTAEELVRKQHAFGIGLTWHYDAGHISRLHADRGEGEHGRTAIGFDYGTAPITVNVDVTAEEAESLVAAVLDRYPDLGAVRSSDAR